MNIVLHIKFLLFSFCLIFNNSKNLDHKYTIKSQSPKGISKIIMKFIIIHYKAINF